jgi:leader peptidase (prepilin peptidase) / N-methyltransferase
VWLKPLHHPAASCIIGIIPLTTTPSPPLMHSLEIYWLWTFLGVCGLCVGSFLNVCIYRMPHGTSLVRQGSRCAACGIRLSWWRNIPVLSWLAQRGRCGCGLVKLDARYPLVECVTAAWFLAVACVHAATPALALVYLVWGCALIVATFIDIDHFIIPDEISLGGCVAGLLCSALVPQLHASTVWWHGLGFSLLGLVVGGGALLLIAILGTVALKKEAMGMGDVKLLAALGAFLGWESTFFIIAISSMLGALLGVAMILIRRGRWGTPIPFGPYIVAAAMIWMLGGSRWMAAYWAALNP